MRVVPFAALALLAALSACGDETDEGPERKTAAGEVLGGSISDAMLPLATVQSQSPPLRESPSERGDKSADTSGQSTDSTDDPEAAASPAPTTEPSAAASASATPQAEN